MRSQVLLVLFVVMAGCSSFPFEERPTSPAPTTQPPTPSVSPTAVRPGTPTPTESPCVTVLPVPELAISNSGYITPTSPKTATVLIREASDDTGQSTVVFRRQFTIPSGRDVEVMDVPGWEPEHIPEGFSMTVRVDDVATVTKDLGGLDGNQIRVSIGPDGVAVEVVFVLPGTVTC